MIYFLFHNQKTNKIFYHLLGRLDIFLFISLLFGSIKFPIPFSFYNSRIGILFFSFLMCSLPLLPRPQIFFFPPLGGSVASSLLWCVVGVGTGRGPKKGHMFAVTHELQGNILNRKKVFFQSFSPLLRGMRTLKPLVKWWLCWFKKKILYYWNLLCGFFPRSTIKTNDVCEHPQHCDYPSLFWIAGPHPSSLLYSWQARLLYSFPFCSFLPYFLYGCWH